jgi:DNA (cytosine-5)-methyltransferase 1
MSLTVGSLFTGIGGLDLGLERAGLGPVLWQVEQEPFCREVLARHWPEAERFDDVRTVGASRLRYVDVLAGGSPCQDLSEANPHGAGLDGPRSGLWFEFLRVAGELRPRFVVFENVPRLVRRGLDRVVAGLDGLGYTVVGTRLEAADVGAWHKRQRLFLVAYLAGERGEGAQTKQEQERRALSRGGAAQWPPAHVDRHGQPQPCGPLFAERRWAGDGAGPPGGAFWASEPDVARMVHGVSRGTHRAAREKALGNTVVPACGEIAGHLVIQIARAHARP